jgi:hypothetical protein
MTADLALKIAVVLTVILLIIALFIGDTLDKAAKIVSEEQSVADKFREFYDSLSEEEKIKFVEKYNNDLAEEHHFKPKTNG